jgi:AcrR family transcriptional regulator
MPEPVNPRMRLRAERAAVTRRRIAEAARMLFARDGYGATTLQAIADEAGVAVQTVYAVFGSKPGILRELIESVVFQPEADALAKTAMSVAETDASTALDLFARSIRIRWEAGSEVVLIAGAAASTTPVARVGQENALERRRGGLRALATAIAPRLRAGVTRDDALATIDGLTMPEVYLELARGLGWTPDAYEAWLATSLRRLLLAG